MEVVRPLVHPVLWRAGKVLAPAAFAVGAGLYSFARMVPRQEHFDRYLKERCDFEPDFAAAVAQSSEISFEQGTFYSTGRVRFPVSGERIFEGALNFALCREIRTECKPV